ncbi:hypothetical protein PPO43_12095 [Saprospira sp. CCB-QB6]|uniref:hypothetical protein n=1 Tax=Saprospira sp. CCB-QB6 TaxID=3023936 RepID=UPI00234A317F|nr:hypothetical protein [Saprospira sp. CCB-QB6]WCL80711.1 hypothetical protein PPO43_12095 [Saprospira sp. CCB-QB6]
MDFLLALKAFFLGFIYLGGIFALAGFLLPIFPLPLLLYIRQKLLGFSDKIALKNEARGRKLWRLSRSLMMGLSGILLLGLLGYASYSFQWVLAQYIPQENAQFWTYFGLGLGLPVFYYFWVVWKMYKRQLATF